jgi:acetyltransferase-like isoleucine patch superfamily enzyme
MSSMVRALMNALAAPLAGKGRRVTTRSGSRVRWWGLRGSAGTITIGDSSIVNARIAFDSAQGKVVIGNRCYLGASLLVCHTGITIGDDVIMSWGITVVDHDSHTIDWQGRQNDVRDWAQDHKDWSRIAIRPVTIEDKVWIGFGASILKGVTLGKGCVVAASSVVTRDVPPFTLVAGNPARIVRQLPAPSGDQP